MRRPQDMAHWARTVQLEKLGSWYCELRVRGGCQFGGGGRIRVWVEERRAKTYSQLTGAIGDGSQYGVSTWARPIKTFCAFTMLYAYSVLCSMPMATSQVGSVDST